MSEQAARAALTRMSMSHVLVNPQFAATMEADIRRMMATDPVEAHKTFMEQRRSELCAAYGYDGAPQRKPFAFVEGMAIIPVSGMLINRFGGSYGWITGYNFIHAQTRAALADDDVKGIIYDHNSYGGEAAGCFECAAIIRAAGKVKPTMAVVDSNCYSASYALASAANKIYLTPSGGVGSIGVVAMHVDMSKMMDDYGIKITFVHAGAHKVDGNPYEKLSDDVRKDMQEGVNSSYDRFTGLVAEYRSLDVAKVKGTEARIYRAEPAKELGLVDVIAPPNESALAFFSELTGSIQPEEDTMSANTEKPATAQATADQAATDRAAVQSAERTRMKAITTCEAAKGRENLANHLAYDTSMSLEEATAILAAAPTSAPAPAPAAATPAPAPAPAAGAGKSQFEQAMDAGQHPNVGADNAGAPGSGDNAPQSKASRILADQAAATGVDLRDSKK